jgi:glycosyltransferase involved in cell wall biosynthesis
VLGLQRLLRARGTRVVWTAHNAGGHETRHPQLEAWFWQAFTRRLDGVISLSEAGLREVWQAFPALAGVPSFVVPHGHYRSAYPPPVPRAEARAALDLPAEAPVILHFGVLRPYKNVPHLIDTFGTMVRQREAERGDAAAPVLVVAGRPETEAVARAVQEAAEAAQAASADVRLRLGFVPDADVPPLFAAADLVALPYAEILNSGTALLALSFDRPVLVPARGAMAELRERVGPGFVRTYARALTPETLAAALRWACPPVPPARAALDALGWDRLAAETHAALEAVCSA